MKTDKLIWLLDTIRDHGRITRAEIERLWLLSPHSEGKKLPRRNFARYRDQVEQMFGIDIRCDPRTFEYYIENAADVHQAGAIDWLLDSAAAREAGADIKAISGRVFLENVPSARHHLPMVMRALKAYKPIKFDYFPYTRSRGTQGVVIEPYFLKIFRQRWYVTGLNRADGKIKTYALDRIKDATMLNEPFNPDPSFDLDAYVSGAFGVIFDNSPVRDVHLKVSTKMAKYLRDLPLHESQSETVHDEYSIFSYKMRLTRDLVQEILSRGSEMTIIAPPELRAMITAELRESLKHYE